MEKIIIFILCFFAVFTVSPEVASSVPQIIYIDSDGSGNYNCDGINDQIEINYAFDNASSGDIVHFNSSTYVLNGTIYTNNSGVTIQGDGDTSILKVMDGATATEFPQNVLVWYLLGDNITVQDLYIDANRDNTSLAKGRNYLNVIHMGANDQTIQRVTMDGGICDAIRCGTYGRISINNCTFSDFWHDTLMMSPYNSTIENNTFTTREHTLLNSAIRIYDSYESTYKNNNISPSGGNIYWVGIKVHNYGNKYLYNLTLENNMVNNGGNVGIHINSQGGGATTIQSRCSGMVIKNNIIPSTPGSYLYGHGLLIEGDSPFNNMTIKNNVIANSVKDGFRVENVGNDNLFENNIIYNVGQYGINSVNSGLTANYNDVYLVGTSEYINVTGTGSITLNPLFCDVVNNDFHLNSTVGRWNGTAWVNMTTDSPCIDAGNPKSDYTHEPEPHGSRINIGAFGGTVEASKSAGKYALVITRLSQIPSTLHQNSTGNIQVIYGITVPSGRTLNESSAIFQFRTYEAGSSDYNHSIRYSHDWWIYSGANRNNTGAYRLVEEDDTTIWGDGYGSWSGLDRDNIRFHLTQLNDTYWYMYINASIQDLVNPQSWILDRTAIQEAPKTLYPIDKKHSIVHELHDLEATRGTTDYIMSVFIDTDLGVSTPKENNHVQIFYLNGSYNPEDTLDPEDTPYAFLITVMNSTVWDTHTYSPRTNATYHRLNINMTEIRMAGIEPTATSYLYFKSCTPVSSPYYINITNAASGTNLTFAQTDTLWIGRDAPFTPYAYTANIFTSYLRDNMQFETKAWAADDTSGWGDSTSTITYIGVVSSRVLYVKSPETFMIERRVYGGTLFSCFMKSIIGFPGCSKQLIYYPWTR